MDGNTEASAAPEVVAGASELDNPSEPDIYSSRGGIDPPDSERLRQLDHLDPAALITSLLDPAFRFRDLLDADTIPEDVFVALTSVLRRMATIGDVAQHAFPVMGLLNAALASQFLIRHVPAFLQRTASGTVLANLVTLFQKMLDRFPGKASESLGFPLAICRDAAARVTSGQVDASIQEALESLEETRRAVLGRYDSMALRKMARNETAQVIRPPPDNFRRMSVTITTADVHQVANPFLRPNVVDGRFVDVEHYLDVHFRLLREDFVAPLRDGIDNLLSTRQLHPTHDVTKSNRDSQIYVYTDIRNEGSVADYRDGIVYRFSFDAQRLGRIDWNETKRLTQGSLVCLSEDNFCSLHLAVIVDRRVLDDFKRVLLVVRMVDENESCWWNALSEMRFTMVESPTYFQAYEPVLRRLKTLGAATLPFQRNIVECRKDLLPPRYLVDDARYDLGTLVGSAERSIHLLDVDNWPSAEYLGLNEAQCAALRLALTKELAIIHGPPGTGKTFLGLKIVKALLANEQKWRGEHDTKNPILVICYTNHALDQFLEGILTLLPVCQWEDYLKHLEKYLLEKRRRPNDRRDDPDFDDYEYMHNDDYYNRYRRKVLKPMFDYSCDMVPIVRVGGRSKNPKINHYGLSTVRRLARESWSSLDERQSYYSQRDELDEIALQIKTYEKIIQKSKTDLMPDFLLWDCMQRDHWEQLKVVRDHLSQQQHDRHGQVSAIADWLGLADAELETEEPTQPSVTDDVEQLSDDEYDDEYDFLSEEERIGFLALLEAEKAVEDDDGIAYLYSDGQFRVQKGSRKRLRRKMAANLSAGAAMSRREAQTVPNIWQLAPEDRWRLYRYWTHELRERKMILIGEIKTTFTECEKELRRKQRLVDTRILRNAKVIGMTTTGAAKYEELLQTIKPRIVIVEEAAEVLEAHIISSLPEGCQHLILIGDHQQLRPNPSVYKLATKYHLDVSLFERLIRNGVPHVSLTQQHRMRPEISALLVPHIYRDLADHPSVTYRAHVAGVAASVFFLNHHHHEERAINDSTSHANEFEARFSLALAKYLLQQGQYHSSEIVILTTYVGQLNMIKRLMKFEGGGDIHDVLCTVVDNYQGEENRIIILSLVRNNEEGNMGFLRVDNRVCVALSRARDGLYCIGNFSGLAEASPLWRNIIESLRRRPLPAIGDRLPIACQLHPETAPSVSDASDFARLAPDGGCCHPCPSLLACGLHPCPRSCHPFDIEHRNIECQVICEKVLCELKHVCGKPCYKWCGECVVKVSKLRPRCGHFVDVPCSVKPDKIECNVLLAKELSCGHTIQTACSTTKKLPVCQLLLDRELECGHIVKEKCGTFMRDSHCRIPVQKEMPCGHKCEVPCHTVKEKSDTLWKDPLCEIPIQKEMPCGHTCEIPCHVDVSTILCRVLLKGKELKCGHTATALCGVDPSAIVCHVPVEKNLPCGHTKTVQCNVDADTIFCRVFGDKELECGHVTHTMCGIDQREIVCQVPSQKDLECGHIKEEACHISLYQIICKVVVEKTLTCGHTVETQCTTDPVYIDCEVQVEKELRCGHITEAACHVSTREIICKAVVEKKLYCGHTKEARCTIDPGNISCDILVVKELPCGHSMETPCRPLPLVDLQCKQPCSKLLSCGHPCFDICYIPCFKVRCQVEAEVTRPCGHPSQVTCHEKTDSEAVKLPCDAPCEAILTCGHRCGGSCGECYGGRLHKRCNEKCSRSLLCGHQCKFPCWQSCPPCQQPCESRCEHGVRCESVCATPCQLKCGAACRRRCEHGGCSRSCQELCDWAPCDMPCPLELPGCGHLCAGLCGEPCPPRCRECERDGVGVPLDAALPDGRLVMLQDCGHVFEVGYLDRWIGVAVDEKKPDNISSKENAVDAAHEKPNIFDIVHTKEKTTESDSITATIRSNAIEQILNPSTNDIKTTDATTGQDGVEDKFIKTGTNEHVATTDTINSSSTAEQDLISLTTDEITNQNVIEEIEDIDQITEDDYNKFIYKDSTEVNPQATTTTTSFSKGATGLTLRPNYMKSARQTPPKEITVVNLSATIDSEPLTSPQEVAIKCCPRCGIAIHHSRRYGNQVKEHQASVLEVKKKIFEDARRLKSELVKLASSKPATTLSSIWSKVCKEARGPRCFSEMVVLHRTFRSLATIDANVATLLEHFHSWEAMEKAWREIFASVSLGSVVIKLLRRLKTYMQRHLDCRETSETQLEDFGRELWRFELLVRLVCSLDYESPERLLEVKTQLDLLYVVLVGRRPFSVNLERLVVGKWESERGDSGSSLVAPPPPNGEFRGGLNMCGGRWFKCDRGHHYHVDEGQCAFCVR